MMVAWVLVAMSVTPSSPAQKAFRAGQFDVACPLFEHAVTRNRFDAWGWNDLALCELKRKHWVAAANAQGKVEALLKASADEKLEAAMLFNRTLLEQSVASSSRNEAVSALKQLHAAGFNISPIIESLPEVGSPMVDLLGDAGAWWRCFELDAHSMKRCGRRWLMCVASDRSTGWVIEASTATHWRAEPNAVDADSSSVPLDFRQDLESGSCTSGDPESGEVAGGRDNDWFRSKLLSVDVCAGTALVVEERHPQCGSTTVEFVERAISPAPPPRAP